MKSKSIVVLSFVFGTFFSVASARAACEIYQSDSRSALERQLARPNADPLARLLADVPSCPKDVFQLRAALEGQGLRSSPSLVANRGFHNPGRGSFSVFESVVSANRATLSRSRGPTRRGPWDIGPGEFFFGHFVAAEGPRLVADQVPRDGALLIELIAWDPVKRLFNFYELIGRGGDARWFYRGDTADVLQDNEALYLGRDGERPRIGARLRCSGCHLSGGPIMKELEAPHNDWWSRARPLPLGGRVPDANLEEILKGLRDATLFADDVKAGLRRLEASPRYQEMRALGAILPVALRPLFCTTEINLESWPRPLGANGPVALPNAFFVHQLLAPKGVPIVMSPRAYREALHSTGSRFPETDRADADHPFLAPVVGESDRLAVDSLIRSGRISVEFAADVLAVDLTEPAFSAARCALLRHVPTHAQRGWQVAFLARLKRDGSAAAQELVANLEDPSRNLVFHRVRAERFLSACAKTAAGGGGGIELLRLLASRRRDVAESEISMNPRGQILEPGFRVVFPVQSRANSHGLRLNESCRVVGP